MIPILVTLLIATVNLGRISANPAWHLDFLEPLVNERLDPIVTPNAVGGHMHDITGGSNFGASYSYAHQTASHCTSSAITVDKSNYWMPKLYGINPGGKSYTPIPAKHRFYYFLARTSPAEAIHPFPEGLRMLMGNPDAKKANPAIKYTCHVNHDLITGDIYGDSFNFARDCPYGIRIELNFPSCWDGITLYKSDQSHMTYPIGNAADFKQGQCPWSHPIKLPQIMLEYTYAPSKWAPGRKCAGNLIWANGDTTGFAGHADFVNGWNTAVLSEALNDPTCAAMDLAEMQIQKCRIFAKYYDEAAATACKPALGVMTEPNGGNVELVSTPSLPGCNLPWGATGPKPSCVSLVAQPNIAAFTGPDGSLIANASQQAAYIPPTTAAWSNIGCLLDLGATGNTLSNSSYYVDDSLTATSCQQHCGTTGYEFAGVSFRDGKWTCQCGHGVPADAAVYPGMCTSKCPGDASQICGATNVHSIFYNPSPSAHLASNGYVGCYRNPKDGNSGMQGKTLYETDDRQMTTEKCIEACKGKYQWAMTCAGQRCLCGNEIQLGGQVFQPDVICSTPCGGNSKEMCGATYANSVYSLTGQPLISANATGNRSTSSISMIPVKGTSTPTSKIETIQSASSWLGSATTLSTRSISTTSKTAQSVVPTPKPATSKTTVTSKTVAPTETTATTRTTSISPGLRTISASDLHTPTSSDIGDGTTSTRAHSQSSTTTAADNLSALQPVTFSSTTVGSPKPTNTSLQHFVYLGCYAPNVTLRHFNVTGTLTSSRLSPADCSSMCWGRSQPYFALARGEWCGCLTDADMSYLVPTASTSCVAPCTGEIKETCGGLKAASVYRSNGETLASEGSLLATEGGGEVQVDKTVGAPATPASALSCHRCRRRHLQKKSVHDPMISGI